MDGWMDRYRVLLAILIDLYLTSSSALLASLPPHLIPTLATICRKWTILALSNLNTHPPTRLQCVCWFGSHAMPCHAMRCPWRGVRLSFFHLNPNPNPLHQRCFEFERHHKNNCGSGQNCELLVPGIAPILMLVFWATTTIASEPRLRDVVCRIDDVDEEERAGFIPPPLPGRDAPCGGSLRVCHPLSAMIESMRGKG